MTGSAGPADQSQEVPPNQAAEQAHEHAQPPPAGGPDPDEGTAGRPTTFEAPETGADASAKVTVGPEE